MPELPEVETARRILDDALVGEIIAVADVKDDAIVLKGRPAAALQSALEGATITATGRRGKYFWLELGGRGILAGHLGMSGAILEVTEGRSRAVHYKESRVNETEKYVKLRLKTKSGREVVMSDARRLSRLWLAESVELDSRLSTLGPDALLELPQATQLAKMLAKRSAPIKAVLLDQEFLSGIGNYLADEVLYQSRISPKRAASSLKPAEVKRLRKAILEVVELAVRVEADHLQFPENWLFHVRWGGKRGADKIAGAKIVRETVGGRTTAWVPSKQK